MTYPYQKRELNADTLTPIAVFNRLQGKKKFILESSSNHEDKGRYSFIGMNPFKEIIATDQKVDVKIGNRIERIVGKPLEIVKEHIPHVDLDLPFAFYSGAVGYIGYDIIRQYEEIGERLEDEINMPDLHLMIYQDLLIFDHQKQTLTIIAVDLTKSRSLSILNEALDQITEQLLTNLQEDIEENHTLAFEPSIDQETFMNKVKEAKKYIANGDIFQVVLSQRMKADFAGDPFYFYRRLRVTNPSPYMYYLDFGDYLVLGASPESLIKAKGQQLTTNPIAGTRPRGATAEIDQKLAEQLLADPKECAEHKMLIDLSRNDLGRVCKSGTIQIPEYMIVERYQHVMHIVSKVTGELEEHVTAIDALLSLLPAGTVSGAPKVKSMQIINQLEDVKRGVYAGAVGYINMNGDLDLAIAIRTMVLKDKRAYVQAGAGIVHDSDPASEYQETLNKAKALLEVAQK
ncbi:anthranilate synthase component I [Amphibacillus sp. Q70]|uniref:anthranilate synthase component I n=1 Tax=Amphibacillus sp. Q70 TaxID=3453416 RepID=UPI003F84CF9B